MLAEEFVAALRNVDSATVANGIEGLEVRDRTDGYADLRLRRVVSQPVPMVGYAVTFKVDSTTPGRRPDLSRLRELIDGVNRSSKPVVAVCQEAGPLPERGCHMGDVIGSWLAKDGVVGIVSGSGVRDLDGIREAGLSAFAFGTVASHGVYTVTHVNVEVEVAGLRVRPGDLLHGDDSGLVSVPTADPERLLRLVAEIQAEEARSRHLTAEAALER